MFYPSPPGYSYSATYDFEAETLFPGSAVMRYLWLGQSDARNIAIGLALVNFFGGRLVYNDQDKYELLPNYCHYYVPDRTDEENAPSAEPDWINLQERLSGLKPLTKEDIAFCDQFAHYKGR